MVVDLTTAAAPAASRDEWLAKRRRGIGASDAASALGVSPYKSRLVLWAEKCKALADEADGEHLEWGLRLERPILDAFVERTGRTVQMHPQHTILVHPEIPWMIATPDAVELGVDRIVQIKTCNAFLAKEWEVEPPLAYQVQVQHELAVTGRREATLVVLIGGQKLKWFDCPRNDRFIDAMIPRLQEFWDLVQSGMPPEADGSESTRRMLGRLYPREDGSSVDLPERFVALDAELVAIKARLSADKKRADAIENEIKAAIGPAEFGILPTGEAYSWRRRSRRGFYTEATEYRQLQRERVR